MLDDRSSTYVRQTGSVSDSTSEEEHLFFVVGVMQACGGNQLQKELISFYDWGYDCVNQSNIYY